MLSRAEPGLLGQVGKANAVSRTVAGHFVVQHGDVALQHNVMLDRSWRVH